MSEKLKLSGRTVRRRLKLFREPKNPMRLKQAVGDRATVSGLTHDFYRYPARFSPVFARETILSFTEPNDFVFDPFMGGGTSIVEALINGRCAVGADISGLAVFIAKVKTTVMNGHDLSQIEKWASTLGGFLNLHTNYVRDSTLSNIDFSRNLISRRMWPIRKTLELALQRIEKLPKVSQQEFMRCVLLKTAQWAIDCRKDFPKASDVRERLRFNLNEMIKNLTEYSHALTKCGSKESQFELMNRSAVGIESEYIWKSIPPPSLIITSPPYPGVHVLYHRWQIQGRRETAAPFWITDTVDGHGSSFYTLGDRKQAKLEDYFHHALAAFKSIAKVANDQTIMVQLIAFSDRSWQMTNYLDVLSQAGFFEIIFPELSNSSDGRLWRQVPNRKWYASLKGDIPPCKEVVLFHSLK